MKAPGKTPDLAKLVGGRESGRPIRLDVSAKADVIGIFGQPQATSRDGRVLVYAQAMSAGWGVNLIGYPGMGTLRQRTQDLRLRFDDHDVLRENTVSGGDSRAANLGYAEYPQPDKVPPDLLK